MAEETALVGVLSAIVTALLGGGALAVQRRQRNRNNNGNGNGKVQDRLQSIEILLQQMVENQHRILESHQRLEANLNIINTGREAAVIALSKMSQDITASLAYLQGRIGS